MSEKTEKLAEIGETAGNESITHRKAQSVAQAGASKMVDWMGRWAGYVGASVIMVMMFLTAVDVCLRYFFNMPMMGSLEIMEYLMAITVALTMAYCAYRKGHIRVDAAVNLLPARTKEIFNSIVMFLGFIFFILVSWRIGVQAEVMYTAGSYSSTLRIPVYPFLLVLLVACVLMSAIFLRDMIDSVAKAVRGSTISWLWLLIGTAVVLLCCAALYWGQSLPWSMSTSTFGLVGIVLLIVLMFTGLHVGLVLGILGFLGMAYLSGGQAGLGLLGTVPYSSIASYSMSVVPLFILMGEFAFFSGISTDLYWTAYKWLGRIPGGLAMATVGACAGFAAICGSSLATSGTLGAVCLPEMRKLRYSDQLATGVIAAGGTLGILIPPSVVMVIYGIMTQVSIGKLFLAGILPGILEAIIYIIAVYVMCKRNPLMGPKGARTSLREKIVSLKPIWIVVVLFSLVMGGMYLGIFSPNEAAGIGAMATFLFVIGRRKLTWNNLKSSLLNTGSTTAMTFFIVLAAMIYGYFLAVTRLPFILTSFVSDLNVDRIVVIVLIYLVYIFLGCIMSSIAMILVTVPIFFPLIVALGFDPIWFGVMIVVMCEIGAITPPVGMNVFVIYSSVKDVPMGNIFKGIIPFIIGDLILVVIFTAFPIIVMLIPNLSG